MSILYINMCQCVILRTANANQLANSIHSDEFMGLTGSPNLNPNPQDQMSSWGFMFKISDLSCLAGVAVV